MNKYFIVNKRLTYLSTQLLMEWIGIVPKKTIYTSYYDVEEKTDEFLFEITNWDDEIYLIGYCSETAAKFKKIFRGRNIKFILSDSDKNSFEYILKSAKLDKLSDDQKRYVKTFWNLLKNNYEDKNSYFLNIVFYNISVDKFYDHFKDGWNDISQFKPVIKEHLVDFSKQSQQVYELNGFYFVNSHISFLGDFIFKYSSKYDNLGLIDLDTNRVYFKKLKSDGKDINKLCRTFCTDIRGFTDFCSGKITDNFLKLTKKMKPVSHD